MKDGVIGERRHPLISNITCEEGAEGPVLAARFRYPIVAFEALKQKVRNETNFS
jgi:hypothetical protein